MKNCFLRSALFLCMVSSTVAYSQLTKIYLQPKATATVKQSQIVDSIRFIPLEVKAGIVINGYNNITVTPLYFIINDYTEDRILLFARSGSFVNEISYKKLGDNFYPKYDEHTNQLVFFGDNKNYALTPKDRVQILQDWSNPANKKYFKKYSIYLNGPNFLMQKEETTEKDIMGANQLNANYYWSGKINTSPLYKDSTAYEFNIYKNNQLVKGFFPYNQINEPRFLYAQETIFLTKINNADTVLITRPFCDTIYKMVNDRVVPAYQLVLPLENTLPASFYTQPFKNKTERENFKRNNGWLLHQVFNFYESPQFIYFAVRFLSNYDSYIYQKQTKATYKTKNIKSDSTQFNLNLLADFQLQRNGNRFYKTQKAGELITFFQKYQTAIVPRELEGFLHSKPNSDAPIIVEFKFKDQ